MTSWYRKRSGVAITVLAGSALMAALALNEIRFNTPSFDGAMNLQVPQSLATTGKYSTTYDAVDELILQTGPPLLLPIALAFRLFGISNWTAQLPNAIYLVGTCALLMLYASRLGGIFAAAAALLLVLATPNLFDLGLRVYGEIPALFFFLAALLLFDAWELPHEGRTTALLMGVCLGLAVLTKTVMFIAFAAVVLTVLVGAIVGLRRPGWREAAAFAAGSVGILGIFELFKLAHLGTTAYAAWWQMMLPAIGQQGGMTDQGQTLANFVSNLGARFSGLSLALGVPPVWLGLFLVSPYLLILLLLAAKKLRGSLFLLASMSGGYLAWWLLFTPLNRIWLRRIVNGILLHELLSVVALAAAVMLVRGAGRAARAGAVALAVAVILGAGAFSGYNLGKLEVRREPTPERVAAERLGKRIRELPEEAVIYGRGWWQAPVVSFFAGRSFEDLDWMPRDLFEADLEQRYFVVDQALAGLAKDELEGILARMEYEMIESVSDHSLLRMRRVYPYRPFAEDEERSDLKKLVNVVKDGYPYVRGLHDPAGGARWARRVAGVLLAREGEGCLKLRLFFPDLNGYPGGRLRLAVEVDDALVRETEVRSAGTWEAVLPVPRRGSEPRSAAEVEVGIDNWWRPAVGNFSQTGFLIEEAGFVDCGTS
jgi:hypothetical protein